MFSFERREYANKHNVFTKVIIMAAVLRHITELAVSICTVY